MEPIHIPILMVLILNFWIEMHISRILMDQLLGKESGSSKIYLIPLSVAISPKRKITIVVWTLEIVTYVQQQNIVDGVNYRNYVCQVILKKLLVQETVLTAGYLTNKTVIRL